MKEDRTAPSRSIRIEQAARAVLAAYDACSHHNDEQDEREYLRQENALLDAAEDLRKELP